MPDLLMYAPLAKVTTTPDGGREVWGFGILEVPDKSGEVCDIGTTLEQFASWSAEIAQASGGKSLGNVREMHQRVAVGTVIDWQEGVKTLPDGSTARGIYIGVKVLPTQTDTIAKIDAGVLCGFSIGGRYLRKWNDPQRPSLKRYTAAPVEMSLVDNPNVPGCTFDVVKAGGMAAGCDTPAESDQGGGAVDLLKAVSMEAIRDRIRARLDQPAQPVAVGPGYWVTETYPDHVIVRADDREGKLFSIPYTIGADDALTLGQPVEVQVTYTPVAPLANAADGAADEPGEGSEAAGEGEGEAAPPADTAEEGEPKPSDGEGKPVENAATSAPAAAGDDATEQLLSAAEAAVADLQKVGRVISTANRDRIHAALQGLQAMCAAAGCEKCAAPVELAAGAEHHHDASAFDSEALAKAVEAATSAAQATMAQQVEQQVRALIEGDSTLAKAAEITGLREDLAKAAAVLPQLEGLANRITKLEDAPAGGAPVLRPDLSNGAMPSPNAEVALLQKMADATADPALKAAIGKELAVIQAKNAFQGR